MIRLAISLAALALLWAPSVDGATRKVDATKKTSPKIIQPSKQEAKMASGLQNKRYRTGTLSQEVVIRGKDKPFAVDTQLANQSRNPMSDQRSSLVSDSSKQTTEILDQVVTSSEEFERAYRQALMIELSKRAAAQVEIRKAKKKASQADINKDAKARRSQSEGFEVQSAGSGAK